MAVVAVGLAVSGCVINEPENPFAGQCFDVVVEGEYGDQVVVQECDGIPAQDARPGPDELLPDVPSNLSRDALTALFATADALNAVCADLAAWAAAGQQAADEAFSVAELVANDPLLVDWTGGGASRDVGALLRNRLVVQSGCEPGAGPPLVDDGLVDDALAAAGRLTGANDAIWFALTDPERPQAASQTWLAPDQIAHVAELRGLLADGRVDVLMVGPATASRAFDPITLSRAAGETYLNTGFGPLPPSVTDQWLEELFDLGADPHTVVLSFDVWEDGLPCNRGAERRADRSFELMRRSFGSVPGLGAEPPLLRLVGGDAVTIEGELAELAASRWRPGRQGLARGNPSRSVEQIERQAAALAERFTDEIQCGEALGRFEISFARLAARGIEPVVVALPVAPSLATLFPGGRDGIRSRLALYSARFADLGVAFVDLSELVDDSAFANLDQLNNDGRTAVTAALVDEFGGVVTAGR